VIRGVGEADDFDPVILRAFTFVTRLLWQFLSVCLCARVKLTPPIPCKRPHKSPERE
jgi:hypothetical protein